MAWPNTSAVASLALEGPGEVFVRGRAGPSRHHDEAALVEQRERVELARTPRRFSRRGGHHETVLPLVKRPLGVRERRPDQRVHQVVPGARTRRHAALARDTCIIHRFRIARAAAAPRHRPLAHEADTCARAERGVDRLRLRERLAPPASRVRHLASASMAPAIGQKSGDATRPGSRPTKRAPPVSIRRGEGRLRSSCAARLLLRSCAMLQALRGAAAPRAAPRRRLAAGSAFAVPAAAGVAAARRARGPCLAAALRRREGRPRPRPRPSPVRPSLPVLRPWRPACCPARRRS